MPDARRSRSARPGRSALGPAILAPAILLGITSPAMANHDFDTIYPVFNSYDHTCYDGTLANRDKFCQTDNPTLSVFREGSINALGKQRIFEVLESQYDSGMSLDVTWPSSPRYADNAETDIIMQQGTALPASDNGFTWCNDAVSPRRCDQHYNQYRYTEVSRRIACHEAGHAVGSVHGNRARPQLADSDNRLGCMQDPIPEANQGELGTLNRHNVNETYLPASADASSDPYKE
jgi:hypothetical protein